MERSGEERGNLKNAKHAITLLIMRSFEFKLVTKCFADFKGLNVSPVSFHIGLTVKFVCCYLLQNEKFMYCR